MRRLGRTLSSVAALGASLGVLLFAAEAAAQAAPQAAPSVQMDNSGDEVEPEAVAALKKMGAFLATLSAFEVRAETARDLVTVNGHRVQVGGNTTYKVRRPNGFQISMTTDYKQRSFYYDGKQFTVYAPSLGYYATAAAPPTIKETLGVLQDKYGIDLPLADLFRWSDPASGEESDLTAGFLVGAATVDGVATDHYAFREKDRDWQIWIQQGAQPLPRKLVIIDLTDEARPAYSATLSWNLGVTIAADAFTFRPGPDAKAIRLASQNQ